MPSLPEIIYQITARLSDEQLMAIVADVRPGLREPYCIICSGPFTDEPWNEGVCYACQNLMSIQCPGKPQTPEPKVSGPSSHTSGPTGGSCEPKKTQTKSAPS